jgi:hypothetical protein
VSLLANSDTWHSKLVRDILVAYLLVSTDQLPRRRRRRRQHHSALGRAGAALDESLGLYPIVTSQYSSTTLYHVSYHMQSLFFLK